MGRKMIILLGKTCSGIRWIQQELSCLGIPKILEYATRPPEWGEDQGDRYHSISDREFYNLYRRGFFAVTSSVKTQGGQVLRQGVAARDLAPRSVLIGNPMQIGRLKEMHLAMPAVFYLDTDEHLIYERLKDRLGSAYEAQRRMVREKQALSPLAQLIDYRIENDGTHEMEELAGRIRGLHEYHLGRCRYSQ